MHPKPYLESLLRMALTGIALGAAASVLVGVFGLIAGWRTALHFSNGMFVVGSVLIIFGILMVWGGFTSRANFGMTYSQSVSDMSLGERSKLWVLDSLRGYNAVVVTTIGGGVMFGLSVLIYQLFGG